ncbi:helix-turn-helix domain-containing protein [Tardiphaga sp. 709]|uniref:helix-turn-helix domain-containing protein n=1 Tax=Tardiphaga sp. 709 TaxID=3076039 RepID=UPI0039657A24
MASRVFRHASAIFVRSDFARLFRAGSRDRYGRRGRHMSWQATNWATQLRVRSPIDKLCLLMLRNRADQDGVCWPSQARLADEGEMSADTVQRSLKRLEADGFIRRS